MVPRSCLGSTGSPGKAGRRGTATAGSHGRASRQGNLVERPALDAGVNGARCGVAAAHHPSEQPRPDEGLGRSPRAQLRQERAWDDLHLGHIRGSHRHDGVPEPADARGEAERRPVEHEAPGGLRGQSPENRREGAAQRVTHEEGLRARAPSESGDRFAHCLVAYSASPALPCAGAGDVHSRRWTRRPWSTQNRIALTEGARSQMYGRLMGAATISRHGPAPGDP